MHARFVAFQAEPENNDTKYIEISLLLSMFYDGAQIYKSKVSKFWPLYYSILNLPPLYRNKAGVGTFMLSLYTGNAGANVEKFLLQKCFVDEMTTLHNGVKYVVGDQHYYIQARTIQYCYDTKALGKELNVQEAGSLAGCPLCVSGKGTRRDTLEKVCYYSDLRNILPMNHILRYSGSSRACCPPNYYTMKESLLAVEIATGAADVHCLQHEYYKIMSQNRGVLAKVPRYLDPSCGPCDNHMPVSWFQDHAPVLSNPKSYVWFHTAPYSFSDFKDVLWYEHCDLRNCIPSARKTMAAFVELGNKAVEQKKPVDGVKGAWFASVLPASDVERDVCFDPFHCLKLVVSWLIGLIKGIKPAGLHKLVKYGAMTNTHYPHLNNGFTTVRVEPPNPTDFVGSKRKIPVQDTTTNPVVEQANPVSTPLPWAVPESVQDIIDAKVNAILVPLTYSNAFQVQSPFKQTGMLRGNAMISLFTVLIDFINLSLTTVPKSYKSFFSMVGTDLRDLMAPQFSEQQLELLERRIQETICLHMGIFPEFESRFAMHELLHISSHIKTMGPVAGWWTFSGERMIAFCKGFVQKGGRSADKAFIKRYDACERARMHMSYNFKEEEATPFEVRQNDLLHSQNVVYTELLPEVQERRDGVVHDPQLFLLFRPDKGKDYVRLNSYELTCLLDSMVAEVYKQCATDEEACQKSPFYRLYCAYRVLYERTFVQTTFGDFLTLLGEYYDGFNVIPENKHVDPRVFKEQIVGPPYMSSLCELAASGIILEQDLPTAVAAAQVGVQKNIYLNAYAFGVRFSARGKDFRETQQPELSYRQTDTDHLNMSVATIAQYRSIQSINTKWSNVRQYSSWCRFRSKNSSFGDHVGPDCYGQINYFFRIKLPEDSVLHGVPFASVVPRKFETEQKVHKIWADPWASYFEAPQLFTSMTSMYASPILVAPYDVKLLPIVPVKKNVVAANAQLVSESKTTVHFFYMIDLQPSYSKSLHYCADMNEHYNRFESILN